MPEKGSAAVLAGGMRRVRSVKCIIVNLDCSCTSNVRASRSRIAPVVKDVSVIKGIMSSDVSSPMCGIDGSGIRSGTKIVDDVIFKEDEFFATEIGRIGP